MNDFLLHTTTPLFPSPMGLLRSAYAGQSTPSPDSTLGVQPPNDFAVITGQRPRPRLGATFHDTPARPASSPTQSPAVQSASDARRAYWADQQRRDAEVFNAAQEAARATARSKRSRPLDPNDPTNFVGPPAPTKPINPNGNPSAYEDALRANGGKLPTPPPPPDPYTYTTPVDPWDHIPH